MILMGTKLDGLLNKIKCLGIVLDFNNAINIFDNYNNYYVLLLITYPLLFRTFYNKQLFLIMTHLILI